MTNYEMAEKLSEKMGVSLEDAKTALEACDWDMLDAALLLEREHGGENNPYTTRQEQKDYETPGHEGGRRLIPRLLGVLKRLVRLGNRNRFEVRRRNSDERILDMPTTIMVLMLLFAFWVCVPLLIIGLFAGFRYSFSGAELGRQSINNAMNKAAEAADKVMDEIRKD